MNSINSTPIPHSPRPRSSRRQRLKTHSSLAGMMSQEEAPELPDLTRRTTLDCPKSIHDKMAASPVTTKACRSNSEDSFNGLKLYSDAEREQLQEMSRKLRRAKRQLLLKSAAPAARPMDQLREILLQLSVDSNNHSTNPAEEDEGLSDSTSSLGMTST